MFGFEEMFDLNGDGKLDSLERGVEFQFMNDLCNEERDVFGEAGLDYDELEMMDPDKRRKVLEDVGLDPDEYDF